MPRALDLFVIVQALWLFLPAYGANMGPVFAMKLFPNWKRPIDAGKNWSDGRRLLGAGKTWRGLWAGMIVGGLVALGESQVHRTSFNVSDFAYTDSGGVLAPLILGTAFGYGAIVGDAVKSFFKRRTGRQGGAPWVPFDQLDFVVGGLLFVALAATILDVVGMTRTNWFANEFLGNRWPVLAILLVLTPLLHFLVNVIGYKLKMKEVPW